MCRNGRRGGLKIPCANNTCGFDPHHRHKKEALQLVWGTFFLSAACERVEQHDPAQQGSNQPCGLLLSARETPTTGIVSSSKSKGFGLLFFLSPASGSFSHVCLHRETADDVLEGVINAERKKGIGAFHGSKGYGRFRCFFVTFSDCSGWFRLRCIWMPTRSSGMRSAKG